MTDPADQLAVVVVADGADRLTACLASVDADPAAPAERVLLVVGGDAPTGVPPMWTVVTGAWTSRAQALDEGWAATRAPWVAFVDTGTPPGFLTAALAAVREADADTAVLCPDTQPGEWDYWALRVTTRFGPRCTWRRAAVELAGWWPRRCDRSLDHALALDLTAAGWKAVRHPGPVAEPRAVADDAWNVRSVGIVSLHAGRESTFSKWETFLLTADLPARTSLYAVDNSRRPEFTERLRATCARIAEVRGLDHVDLTVTGLAYPSAPDEWYLKRERNLHVARLYAAIFPRVREDVVFTLEDDIDPPPDAVRRLVERFAHPADTPLAGISAAWDRVEGRNVCGGFDDGSGGWGSAITWAELPHEPLDVGCIGGACTAWSNAVLARMPVKFQWDEQMGWDGLICTQARRLGFAVRIHGGVRCVHHTWGVLREAG